MVGINSAFWYELHLQLDPKWVAIVLFDYFLIHFSFIFLLIWFFPPEYNVKALRLDPSHRSGTPTTLEQIPLHPPGRPGARTHLLVLREFRLPTDSKSRRFLGLGGGWKLDGGSKFRSTPTNYSGSDLGGVTFSRGGSVFGIRALAEVDFLVVGVEFFRIGGSPIDFSRVGVVFDDLGGFGVFAGVGS